MIRPITLAISAGLLSSAAIAQDWATFVNQTSQRLVADASVGVSDFEEKDFAFADLDLDGDIDLVLVRKQPFTTSGGRRNVLFMNEGIADGHSINGVLVDRTAALAPSMLDATNDRDVVIADVNGDGWPDVITATTLSGPMGKAISHPRVYINRGLDANGNWLGLIFDDVDRMPTFPCEPRFCAVAAGDLNHDGHIDLFFADYDSGPYSRGCDLNDRLLINNGNGYFTDQTASRMTAQMVSSGFGTAAQILDFNGDGRNDVLRGQSGGVHIVYNSTNNPGFFDRFQTPYTGAAYFVAAGDLNNDNRPDLAVADDGLDRYLLNTGNNTDGTASWLNFGFSGDDGFGANTHFADIDNDGFLDVFITDVDVDIPGCDRRMHIYHNKGNLPNVTLKEEGTCGIPTTALRGTHDVAIFDINGDGWLDLVIGRCTGTSIWIQVPPAGFNFAYPQGRPETVNPDQAYPLQVHITGVGVAIPDPSSARLHTSINGAPYTISTLNPLGGNLYQGTLPAMSCTSNVSYYVSIKNTLGQTFNDPPNAPAATYWSVAAVDVEDILVDEIEGDVSQWIIISDPGLAAGAWEQAIPNFTLTGSGQLAAPDGDATPGAGVRAFVTLNGPPGGAAAAWDVDGGYARLISPEFDLSGTDGWVSYARWFFCDDIANSETDALQVDISNNGGATWLPLETVTTNTGAWTHVHFRVGQYITPSATMRLRFSIADIPNNSTTEGGVDDLVVSRVTCGSVCPGDVDGDGATCQSDLAALLAAYNTCVGDPGFNPNANIATGGSSNLCIDQADLAMLLGDYGCGNCP